MEIIGIILFVILVVWLLFFILLLPEKIAKSRGVTGSELHTITLLCWSSLLVGLTWFIALILSLTYHPNKWIDKDEKVESAPKHRIDLDGLQKLFDLKKKGVLTEEEYLKGKRKLMG